MASSSRVLGKGRVLGAAPKAAAPPTIQHARNHSLLSPSDSSVSLSSQISTSKSSTESPPDISAAAALEVKDGAAPAAASTRLVCPICDEAMVTLLQLNRHIDDTHQHLEEVEQDEVKTWFKSQLVKAKKFQPLAVLNQKLKGLDMFEVNDAPPTAVPTSSPARHASPSPAPARLDPDEVVTRQHWQRYTPDNACSDPMCGKRLGVSNGNINCRHCGKLFCEEHTMYQMKLSRTAEHDPVRGYWSRVCETCYKSRQGYNDYTGVERNHMDEFKKTRRKAVDKAYLEVSRLEKRLTKLTQLLADPQLDQDQGALGYLRSFTGSQNLKRLAEQSVVEWEDDASVAQCRFCQQEFSNYTFRRHHCRICGRVVCADPSTGCSTEVGLDVDTRKYIRHRRNPTLMFTATDQPTEKGVSRKAVDVRMCKDCNRTLFTKADFDRETAHIPPDLRAFQHLQQFEHGIRTLLPRFQKLLTALQDPDKPPTPAQLAEATKVRKRLTDSFTQYDVAARRIRDLPAASATQARLQKAVYLHASSFLHRHMLPLKALPRLLKHASPHGHARSNSARAAPLSPNGHLAPAAAFAAIGSAGTATPSDASSALSSLEADEKELRERLAVLEEQRFMVATMVAEANRRRKFDEVAALAGNVEDLEREIAQARAALGRLDFAGAYAAVGKG